MIICSSLAVPPPKYRWTCLSTFVTAWTQMEGARWTCLVFQLLRALQGILPRMMGCRAIWLTLTWIKWRYYIVVFSLNNLLIFFPRNSNLWCHNSKSTLKGTLFRHKQSWPMIQMLCLKFHTGIQHLEVHLLKDSSSISTCSTRDWWTFNQSYVQKLVSFFVKKKSPEWIRLIIDGRQANFHHKRPPTARLGSSSCLAELRLREGQCAFGQEMDVSDCFYQFRLDEAGAWFGLDEPQTASQWAELGMGVTSVYDKRVGFRRALHGDELLYPVVSAMPMGWSWALYLANECVAHAVRRSAPSPLAELREKLPVSQLHDFSTVTSTYVDNVTILGDSYEKVKTRAASIQETFDSIGIPVVWTQSSPVQLLDSVGCSLDLLKGTISNKPSRVWRVYVGGLELAKRGRVQVKLIEIWLGHATTLFRLKPCLLSVFDKIYRFIDLGRNKRWPLWPAVRREIRQACGLVWLASTNLRSTVINQVDAGDSADHGFAMMTRGVASYRIERMLKFREKWRFCALPDDVVEALERKDRGSLLCALERHSGFLQESQQEFPSQHNSFVRFGFGLDTQYGQWIQQALEEGDWLRTSAISSQKKTRKAKRPEVDLPALVEPVEHGILDPTKYKLLWAKRWRDPLQTYQLQRRFGCVEQFEENWTGFEFVPFNKAHTFRQPCGGPCFWEGTLEQSFDKQVVSSSSGLPMWVGYLLETSAHWIASECFWWAFSNFWEDTQTRGQVHWVQACRL